MKNFLVLLSLSLLLLLPTSMFAQGDTSIASFKRSFYGLPAKPTPPVNLSPIVEAIEEMKGNLNCKIVTMEREIDLLKKGLRDSKKHKHASVEVLPTPPAHKTVKQPKPESQPVQTPVPETLFLAPCDPCCLNGRFVLFPRIYWGCAFPRANGICFPRIAR